MIEFLSQINCTVQVCGCDECILICYCMTKHVYRSFCCSSHLLLVVKVKVFLSYANLTMSKSTEQCICSKFYEKFGKLVTETYQLTRPHKYTLSGTY
jgi:hypothetical protein